MPLVEDLTQGPIPPGSNILVEFDPASQWYNACVTIAAGWLRTGGAVSYNVATQPPDEVRSQLLRFVPEVADLEAGNTLKIIDVYTATLGHKSKEKYSVDSLKVTDASIEFSELMRKPPTPDRLMIEDDITVEARFSDEKNWVEFELSRDFPHIKLRKMIGVTGILRGALSDWALKRLEGAADGIIDIKVDEAGNVAEDLIRVRNMRGVAFNREWHHLNRSQNFEVTLDR